jgi:hypothetical protein
MYEERSLKLTGRIIKLSGVNINKAHKEYMRKYIEDCMNAGDLENQATLHPKKFSNPHQPKV